MDSRRNDVGQDSNYHKGPRFVREGLGRAVRMEAGEQDLGGQEAALTSSLHADFKRLRMYDLRDGM